MRNIFAVSMALGLFACSGGSSGTSGSTGTTWGGTSGGSGGSTGTSGQCNMTVTGTPHSGIPATCTTQDHGGGAMELGMSNFPGCAAGEPCSLTIVVPQASGTVDCPATGSINEVSYAESNASGISAQAWSGCGQMDANGNCTMQGTCSVNVSSFSLQNTSVDGAFGHFAGTISAHLVPNPAEPNGQTMDVSANGSW